MKASIMFARFPYGNVEHPSVTDWMIRTAAKAKEDPRISRVANFCESDTPITMLRNKALKRARDEAIDLVLMVDSDMKPDMYLGIDPTAKPFYETAMDLAWVHKGPCCIAAPYAGPPPHEVPYIFQWTSRESEHPSPDVKLEMMTREMAACRAGVEEVPALPTGLILIDMRVIKAVPPPWFEYEYADPPYNTEKATTEDVFFTRNCSLAGIPQYVLWDCWAGHYKQKCVGKSVVMTCDAVAEKFREGILNGQPSDRKLAFSDHIDNCMDAQCMPARNGQLVVR